MAHPTAPQALSAQQLQHYHDTGYHIARGLFAAGEVALIRDTFMAMASAGPVEGLSEITRGGQAYNPADPLARYPRMMHPHRHMDKPVGPLARRYLLDRRIAAILRDLFGEEPIAAQSMFYFKPPGARGQDFHQDNFYLRVQPGTCMAAWLAVDDADGDNGGMMVVPGSHRMAVLCPQKTREVDRFFTDEHLDVPPGMQCVQAPLKAGDCLFFNGSLIHGSHPNTSRDRFRRSFICHYLPASCIEVAHWYKPLLDFSGRVVSRQEATGGGPCGTPIATKGPH